MPLYDYRCQRCDSLFEVRQSFSDDALTLCPAQGGPAACTAPGEGPVKKVFSGVGISFKGDGFYKNDHGANAKGRRRDVESSSKESTGSSDSSSSSSSSSTTKDSGSSTKGSSDSGSSSSSSSSGGSKTKASAGASS